MAKRFSAADFGLLTLPVLFLGGLGFWLSRQPRSVVDDRKPHLTFHIDKPTTLEAFQGYDRAFVVEALEGAKKITYFQQGSPSLELQTQSGVQKSHFRNRSLLSGVDAWGGNLNNSRFTFKLRSLPAGTLHFAFDGWLGPQSNGSAATPRSPLRLSGRWKVDRTQIQPLNLGSLPRKPLISLHAITITRTTATNVTGEIVFNLDGARMDGETPVIMDFSSAGGGMSWGTRSGMGQPATARSRVVEWTASPTGGIPRYIVSGRVSADGRWPLGFQIEPFNAKDAKVGRELKFKAFPVRLPLG